MYTRTAITRREESGNLVNPVTRSGRRQGLKALLVILSGGIFYSASPIELRWGGTGQHFVLLPIVYGLPGEDTFQQARRGEIVLGGCTTHLFAPAWVLLI